MISTIKVTYRRIKAAPRVKKTEEEKRLAREQQKEERRRAAANPAPAPKPSRDLSAFEDSRMLSERGDKASFALTAGYVLFLLR